MKKILSNVYLLAALFMIGAAITSCSKSDDTPAPEPKPVGPTTYTMTIKATKSADAKTRALGFDDKGALNATWATTENVYVKKDDSWALSGSLQPETPGAETVLKGDITMEGGIKADDALTLQFPKNGDITYAGQLGTLSDIAANFDWATADVTVASVTGKQINVSGTTEFENLQAIVKFTLLDKADETGNTKLNPTDLTINYGTTASVSLTDIPAATYNTNGDGVLYVAIPGFSNQNVTLTAIVGNNVYTYEKSSVSFSNGSYYAINVKMEFDPFKTPLTLECCDEGGSLVTINECGDLHYKVNNGAWTSWPPPHTGAVQLSNGGKVSFLGDYATKNGQSSYYMQINCDRDCYVYGNIMSLLYSTDFAGRTDLPTTYTGVFAKLFAKDNYVSDGPNNIKHKEGYDLVLPASELTKYTYMMTFYGCQKLNHIRCLATNFLTDDCTLEWVVGVPIGSDGTFVVDSSLSTENQTEYIAAYKGENAFWYWGDSGIPSGWTVSK